MNNTILQNLKPCPFCGHEINAAEIEMTPNGCDNLRVHCACGATIEFEGDEIIFSLGFNEGYRCGMDAIEKWNKRKEPGDFIKCEECKHFEEYKRVGYVCHQKEGMVTPYPEGFCSYAKRRDEK